MRNIEAEGLRPTVLNGERAELLVPGEGEGRRLDWVLARFHSGMTGRGEVASFVFPSGLRGWRRWCEAGRVRVQGRPVRAASKVHAGQRIEIVLPDVLPMETAGGSGPVWVESNADLAALCKPAGWHSVALTAGESCNVQDWVRDHLADICLFPSDPGLPCLLNRLDCLTSGIVMIARSPGGRTLWQKAEESGQIHKWYVALVEGTLQQACVARQVLCTRHTRKTKILPREHPDMQRHTCIIPLACLEAGSVSDSGVRSGQRPMTLVACHIHKGARHQIRAHMAAIGHPLAGDVMYGGVTGIQPHLHHVRLEMPGFLVHCPPHWGKLPSDVEAMLRNVEMSPFSVDAVRKAVACLAGN